MNASITYMRSDEDEVGVRTTTYNMAADGFAFSKGLAFNNDGSEAFVTDVLMQIIIAFTWDSENKVLVKKEEPNTYVLKGRMDNMKPVEGTDHIMGGNIESGSANQAFETKRAGETWGSVTNVEECIGGAEEFRRNEDGEMESRY
jgi:sugar lactone lactonase YvrE